MPRLFESLSKLADRMEILARGVDAERKNAELALERGRPLEAREHARALLLEYPGSAVGLALWAEAAEAAWLDEEASIALTELSRLLPWRQDVWLRLGLCLMRAGREEARDALLRAAEGATDAHVSRRALLALADMDLSAGDTSRAERWLDRIAVGLAQNDEPVLLRRIECALARGDIELANRSLPGLSDTLGTPLPRDEDDDPGRRDLARGRTRWAQNEQSPDPRLAAEAVTAAERAYLLEVPGAQELLARIVAATDDVARITRLRTVIGPDVVASEPTLSAAFALAEGRRGDARAALLQAVASGHRDASVALLGLALEGRDEDALVALERSHALPQGLAPLLRATRAMREGQHREAFEALDGVSYPDALPWAEELRVETAGALLAAGSTSLDWLELLREQVRRVGTIAHWTRVENLVSEQQRPIVLSIVGEFNAGKSTFINALLGADVAPTGILPTTATLHRLAFAPDRFARILVRGSADRVVTHEALKQTLSELAEQELPIDRVQIYAPIERLRWVEILDTPGFNAPDPEHARIARSSFSEVDVVVWLLDATGAMKASEAEVLQEVCSRGLPVLVLLNKKDRIKPGDEARVLAYTEEGLSELGITPHAPPLLMSAKGALARRSEEPSPANDETGFSEVLSMLSRVVVDRADELRAASLRRRALSLLEELSELSTADAQQQEQERLQNRVTSSEQRSRALRLFADIEGTMAFLQAQTESERRLLVSDLQPLAQLSDRSNDWSARAYAAERFVHRLSGPAARLLGERFATPPWQSSSLALISAAIEAAVLSATQPEALIDAEQKLLWFIVARAAAHALLAEAAGHDDTRVEIGAEHKRLLALEKALREHPMGRPPSGQDRQHTRQDEAQPDPDSQ